MYYWDGVLQQLKDKWAKIIGCSTIVSGNNALLLAEKATSITYK